MTQFDEWIAQHYPMFELTGDREEDETARLVRIVALDLFNQRQELLEACKVAEWNSLDLPDYAVEQLRAAIAKATGEK